MFVPKLELNKCAPIQDSTRRRRDHGGLARLPGACQDLQEAAFFLEPLQQFVVNRLTYHTIYSMH